MERHTGRLRTCDCRPSSHFNAEKSCSQVLCQVVRLFTFYQCLSMNVCLLNVLSWLASVVLNTEVFPGFYQAAFVSKHSLISAVVFANYGASDLQFSWGNSGRQRYCTLELLGDLSPTYQPWVLGVQQGGTQDPYDSLWFDPAGDWTHDLPVSGPTRYYSNTELLILNTCWSTYVNGHDIFPHI